jgi:outer membrane protein assembly factor BamB
MKRVSIAIAFTLLTINALCQIPDFTLLPQLAWKFKAMNDFVASPVIEHDIIYIGSIDSNMYAVSLTSGKMIWKFKTAGQIRSTVCINGNDLFFMSGDGIYCLDKTKGKQLRKYKTGGEKQYDVYDYHQGSPVIYNGKLYIGSSDSNIYVFNPVTLELLWKYKTNGMVHAAFAFGKGKLFAGSFDGNLYAINADNGQLVWKFKSLGHDFFPKGELQFPPTYANDRVYIGGRDYNLYAIDAEKGIVHWTRAYPGGWVTDISLSPRTDSVLLVTTSDPLVLVCMDGIYGSDIWETKMKSEVFGKCVFSQSKIYVGTALGKLDCIDRKTGKIEWAFTNESYVANQSQYLKTDETLRDDIDKILKTGDDYITMSEKLGGIFNTVAITNDYIVFSSMNGTLYCLKRT